MSIKKVIPMSVNENRTIRLIIDVAGARDLYNWFRFKGMLECIQINDEIIWKFKRVISFKDKLRRKLI